MFEKIIKNKQSPTLVTIQDSNSGKAVTLFNALLKSDIEDDNIREIHLMCCKYPPSYYITKFVSDKIVTYDMFRDPCNWLKNDGFNCDKILKEISHIGNNKGTLMIDSANSIILQKNLNYLCSLVHNLKGKFRRVTCLLHGDLLKQIECDNIFFFSNIYIKVHHGNAIKNVVKDEKHLRGNCFIVEGIEKKLSGKVTTVKEIVNIDSGFNIRCKIYENEKKEKSCVDVRESMKGLTTFRMGLNIMENEKIAKDNLVLPYLRNADKKEGEGKIVYYAEPGDDLEEDPDEDLDI